MDSADAVGKKGKLCIKFYYCDDVEEFEVKREIKAYKSEQQLEKDKLLNF